MSTAFGRLISKFNQILQLNNKNVYTYLSLNSVTQSSTSAAHEIVNPFENKCLQGNSTDVMEKVNEQLETAEQGRAFAIVHLAGKQLKVTEGDIVTIEGYWPPSPNDKIKLDKVLLAGTANFSLIGKPLVQSGLVNIYATIIEKTLSHTKTNFKKKRRKQYTNINFFRVQQTMVRINKIEIRGDINKAPEVTGHEHTIF